MIKPGELIAVYWTDITSHDDISFHEARGCKPAPVLSVGFVVCVNDSYLNIVSSMFGDDGNDNQLRNVLSIPIAVIRKIRKYQEVDNEISLSKTR